MLHLKSYNCQFFGTIRCVNPQKIFSLLLCIIWIVTLCGCGVQQEQSPSGPLVQCCPFPGTTRAYTIKGKTYYPQNHYGLQQCGIASHYGMKDGFHGKPTSIGQKYDHNKLTAAHPTAPLPCVMYVENLENGRSICVEVIDRGPYINRRIIDVSTKTAKLLGFYAKGTAWVRITILPVESHNLAMAYQRRKTQILARKKRTVIARRSPRKVCYR